MMPAIKLSESWMLSELLIDIGKLARGMDREIGGLSMDAASLRPGELFLACAGVKRHGRDFIDQAIANGAAAVLCEVEDAEKHGIVRLEGIVPVMLAYDLKRKIGYIADRFYGQPSKYMTVIGVTGTNGKTSTSQFIAQALNQDAPCGVIGTLGYGLYGKLDQGEHTTPNAIRLHELLSQMRVKGAKSVAMEVSSHGLDQGRVNGVSFNTAVFTNLSRDHLDYHGDMGRYGAAKRRLFDMPGLRHAVINADDAFGRALIHSYRGHLDLTAYSLQLKTGAHGVPMVAGEDLVLSDRGISMTVVSGAQRALLRSPLLGRFNASNLLAALAVLLKLGMPLSEAVERIAACQPVDGRMQCYGGGAQPLVVVDYAHTPDALEQVLLALQEHCAGQLWCVFGCGGDRDKGKRPLMGRVAEACADRLIVTDDNPRSEDGDAIVNDILAELEFSETIEVIRDRGQAIAHAIAQAQPGDIVLVAGKGHEDYQIIGARRLPFSDSAAVEMNLALRREGIQ